MKPAFRVLCTASLGASWLLSHGRARADGAALSTPERAVFADPGSARASRVNAAEVEPASSEQAASAAYQRALVSYSSGDLAAALTSMQQSYQLSKRPELLYNLAQIEDELKVCAAALEHYLHYLELVPQGRYRETAQRARTRLERECPAPAAPVSAAAVASTRPDRTSVDNEPKQSTEPRESAAYWTTARVIGWSAIATGTLAGASAFYFQLEAIHAKDEFQQNVDRATNRGTPLDDGPEQRQHRENERAIALTVAASALVAGGVLMLLFDPGKHEGPARSARLYAAPGMLGACYSQGF